MGTDNEIAILTAASAFLGVLAAVLLTEALSARRRRREGRAALVSLLAQITEARAAIRVLKNGIGNRDRISRLLEFRTMQDRVVELENRLSIDEIDLISKWLFQAATAFDDYLRIGKPPYLDSPAEVLTKARQLTEIETQLSESFRWLRRPRETRRLKRDRRALIEEDSARGGEATN